jgi:phosphatidylglycerol:prolipoprotein diacylglycerol transferase
VKKKGGASPALRKWISAFAGMTRMHPELFRIPLTALTVKSYGTMLVIGFLAAVYVIRRLSRDITPDPNMITNASLYALVAGVVGARIFYVVHYYERFRGDFAGIFKIWEGGLELLGGVLGAIVVIIFYLRYHKLPARRYLDILAIGLMLALVLGKIGCFLNGCCFGRPSDLPWAVRFPAVTMQNNKLDYSLVFQNQVRPDPKRSRPEAELKLPSNFFESGVLKPYDQLTTVQKQQVTTGPYQCLAVHPTQLYASANAAILTGILYFFWRRSRKADKEGVRKIFTGGGSIFALMFILYGLVRFFEEFLRDDNPFETAWWTIYNGGTISQNLSIYMVIAGIVLMFVFQKMSAGKQISGKS